jgi:two-component system response regulator HydG
MTGRVLIVDDDREMCELVAVDLKRRGVAVSVHTSAEEAFAAVMREPVDVVVTDLRMPRMTGLELCTRVAANLPDVPVIVMTAFGSLESAIEAIRAGAYDFVTKPIELELLAASIRRALDSRRLREQLKILGDAVSRSRGDDALIGSSRPMDDLREQIDRVADSETSVLVCGESGTGKELVARTLHRRSRRAANPFVPINCSALPHALLESELFGHTEGAFTGARGRRKGLFLQADGGTLFLDEIGDLPIELQPKLLRVLESRAVRAVGSDVETSADVRVIAATHRDLESDVEAGRFRQDLFFRVNVIQLRLPPLRARGTDVLVIAQRSIEELSERSGKKVTGFTEKVAERLLAYPWPGNVRELRNAMEHALALTRFDRIAVEDLPERIRAYRASSPFVESQDPAELAPLKDVERRYIRHVLETVGGSRTLAARILGLDRKTLYRKLQRYENHDAP